MAPRLIAELHSVTIGFNQYRVDAGAVASVDSLRYSYDNAFPEAFSVLFKAEQARNKGPRRSIDDPEIAVAEYID